MRVDMSVNRSAFSSSPMSSIPTLHWVNKPVPKVDLASLSDPAEVLLNKRFGEYKIVEAAHAELTPNHEVVIMARIFPAGGYPWVRARFATKVQSSTGARCFADDLGPQELEALKDYLPGINEKVKAITAKLKAVHETTEASSFKAYFAQQAKANKKTRQEDTATRPREAEAAGAKRFCLDDDSTSALEDDAQTF